MESAAQIRRPPGSKYNGQFDQVIIERTAREMCVLMGLDPDAIGFFDEEITKPFSYNHQLVAKVQTSYEIPLVIHGSRPPPLAVYERTHTVNGPIWMAFRRHAQLALAGWAAAAIVLHQDVT